MNRAGSKPGTGRALRDISRGSFFLGLDQGLGIFFGIIYSIIVLRYLGPGNFGILSLSLSIAGIATIGTGNFEAFLERYVAEFNAAGNGKLIVRAHLAVMTMKMLLSLAVAAVLFLLSGPVSHSYGMPVLKNLLPVITLTMVLEAITAANRATLFGLQRFGSIVVASGVSNSAKVLLILPMIRKGGGVTGVAWVIVLALGLSAALYMALIAPALRNLARHGDDVPPGGSLPRMILRYCAPLLGARSAYLAGQHLSRIILGYMLTPHSLGIFSFAFNVIERFVALGQAVPQSILPSLARLKGEGDEHGLLSVFSHSYRAISVLASFMSAAIFVFAREITLVMGGSEYLDGILLLRILAFVPLARTAQQPLTMLFYTLEKTGTVLALALVKLFAETSLYIILVPFAGLAGAGSANLASVFITFVQAVFMAGTAVSARFKQDARRKLGRISILASCQCACVAALFLPFGLAGANAVVVGVKIALFPAVFAACMFLFRLVSRDDISFVVQSIPGGRRLAASIAGSGKRGGDS